MIAALYVLKNGPYYGLPDVDPWDKDRDARLYDGPWPVVAHPPCERWGRYWFGSPSGKTRKKLGDDDGCFAAALAAVRKFGGVLEHPADSHAWEHFGLFKPLRHKGWVKADFLGGWTCYVEQGNYGHPARKPTWLYALGIDRPELNWKYSGQRLPEWQAPLEKRIRCGYVGGQKKSDRPKTPPEFRDLLLAIARTARKPG